MPVPIGALIGFGGQVANFLGQQYQADKAFQNNKELAQLQNQYNIDQWNRENAYNSPMAQMTRYKEAGLNPNLIYGQQNLSANSPELVGGTSYQSPNANIFDAQAVAQLDLLNAQKENIQADTANKEADTVNKEEQNVLMQTEEKLNESMAALNESQKKEVEAKIPLIQTEVKKTFEEYRKAKIDANRANEFYDAQIRHLQSETNLNNTRARDIINTFQARVNALIAEANRNDWEASKLDQEVQILTQKYTQEVFATEIAEAEKDVKSSKTYQWLDKGSQIVGRTLGAAAGIAIAIAAGKKGKAPKGASGKSGWNETWQETYVYDGIY